MSNKNSAFDFNHYGVRKLGILFNFYVENFI